MLTLFHDPTSPASAVAVMRLTRLAQEGLPVAFEGFDAVGVDAALPPGLDTLAVLERVAEEAAGEGLVLARPTMLPPTGAAHVLLAHAEGTPHAHELRVALYRAMWEEGADIGDAEVLEALATRAGLDGAAVADLLADRVALAARRRQMAALRREGVGGVPVILVSRTLVPGLLPEAQLRELAARA